MYQALREHYQDVTKIMIVQRIASARQADRIVVLDRGTVESAGTHEELLVKSAVYRDIYESQQKAAEGGAL